MTLVPLVDRVFRELSKSAFIKRFWLLRKDKVSKEQYCEASLLQAKDYVRVHYAERLSVVDVAEALDVGPFKLYQLFRKEGISFEGFLNEVRVEKAKVLLARKVPVIDIARQIGFPTTSKFRTIFTRIVGESPTVFQRNSGGAA